MSKTAYVQSEAKRGAGNHHCHWPGCEKSVPPAMWGCKPHWVALPTELRNMIWDAYVPGQEISKTPSPEYILVAQAVQEWIEDQQRAEAIFGKKL